MALIGKTNEEKIWNYLYSKLNNNYAVAGFSTTIKQINGLYKVQLGAFKNKANAELMLESVKARGFDAFITYC